MKNKKNNYIILENNSFIKDDFSIVPIRFEDKNKIMEWRNEQMYHLRQAKKLTEEDQDYYFKNIVSKLFEEVKPNQILFSYLKGNQCIGYGGLVHINWIDKNAEISFIMDTSLEKESFNFHWKTYLELIEKVAFDELNFHKVFTYAFDLRPNLYNALQESNYRKEAVLKDHCFYDNEFKDVIIHSKINYKIDIRKVNKNDVRLLFDWSNDTLTRQNSYQSKEISFSEHKKWFTNKIKDNNSLLLIGIKNNQSVGLIRFDIMEENSTIGITLDKNFRGKKLAQILLIEAAKKYFKEFKKPILAYIKKENVASVKSFEKAGYNYYKQEKINNIDSYVYKLEKR
ncbi:GNAT family N-acetyltransferase [Tenacibaculum sp. HL-MS23]|uniref:GNAT family N-acetyltransferase n=1 Tax=unclassified Tenacibaculum TaxID=2635139 RepID=UPI001C4F79C6|nr:MULTISPECIES: GNAT family N-acetyltransferase [unclassified Tenacibaculum]QXP73887.1 GNAT family N-acetyltransferase [Tenacibaculum sp. AHE14PA]QXP75746.1 GNAT family N-acetyltransferase [Tenacibaculum sp. AHE15PA]WNW02305.1 GNAT family N-acetyltransferase [Tenacibaculum sp. HL-MS23]